MPVIARAASSRSAAMLPSSATPFWSAMNGSRTQRCTNNLPLDGRRYDQARHTVSASLALLHRAQVRGDRGGNRARPVCRLLDRLMEFQRHHIVFGVIALVVAAALAANYYLW